MVTIYYLYVEPCYHIYGRKRTVKIKSELNRIEKYDSVDFTSRNRSMTL